jgi:hypothetical protein
MAVRIARTVPSLVKARITTTEPDPNTGERTMPQDMTLLELVKAVSDHARSEAEVIAIVVYLVNSGRVRLCGSFKDARFDLRALVAGLTAA